MAEHLTDQQEKILRKQLQEQAERLRGQIREELLRSDNELYQELAGQVHDDGEESVADMLADLNTAMVGKFIGELRETEAALQRMDLGAYGFCEDCDAPIPFERLQVYPSARRCLEHQERHERLFSETRPSL